MLRTIPIALICSLILSTQSNAQDVVVPRQSKALPKLKKEETPAAEAPKPVVAKAPEISESKKGESERAKTPKTETASVSTKQDPAENSHPTRASAIKFEPVRALSVKESAPSPSKEKVRPTKTESSKSSAMNESGPPAETKTQSTKAESNEKIAPKEPIASLSADKTQSPKPTKSEPAESAKSSVSKTSVASIDPEKKPVAKSEPAHAKEPITKATASSQPAAEKNRSVKPETKPTATKETQEEPGVEKERVAKTESTKQPLTKATASSQPAAEKNRSVKTETKPAPTKDTQEESRVEKERVTKTESAKQPITKATASSQPAAEQNRPVKTETKPAATKETPEDLPAEKERVAKTESTKPSSKKEKAIPLQSGREGSKGLAVTTAKQPEVTKPKSEPIKASLDLDSNSNLNLSASVETASTRLADGFDFPVGKPEAEGYYKARGFRPNGHAGEDWDGVRGGDTDLKDPIYCIGDGIVVFAHDVHMGWGKVVIVRHGYKQDGGVRYIDSLYGHLDSILVKRGQKIRRGQQIATMGTAHGQYDAHLHFEIRKNIEIGMSKSKFSKNYSNYFSPSEFIVAHRHIQGGGTTFRVAMNTFTHDAAFKFDNAPNYSARKRSTAESSAALKRAISSTSGAGRD
jgi:murein DD-endopeptidase MepM/ murein hydrolase activator NlpD